jgi:diaminopimelate decarboxylase
MDPWPKEYADILRGYLPGLRAEEPLVHDTVLGLYGFDSIALVTLLVELEATFHCPLMETTATIEAFYSAGSLWDAVSAVSQGRTGRAALPHDRAQ